MTKPKSEKPRVLIVDDEESIRKLLGMRFGRENWVIQNAENGKEGLDAVKTFDPHLVVSDIKMPEMDGFQLLDQMKKDGFDQPVIMITGHGEKECAIDAIHYGAFDYLEKPFDMEQIAITARRALEREFLRRENLNLVAELKVANSKLEGQLEVKTELLNRVVSKTSSKEEILVGKSSHLQSVREMIKTISENVIGDKDPVVLITGESGVGKEVVAQTLHEKIFGKEKPFVAINCAAFPDHLLESELFGYEKGAFTGAVQRKLGLFELASGGTLFLDEIGEMDLKMQAKLLRVLQERVIRRVGGTNDISVKAYIVAATNRDLSKMVSEQKFREDLYYRINTLPLSIAPLRSRSEDISEIADAFLRKSPLAKVKKIQGFSIAATKAMRSYRWPGNVRELKSVVDRAIILERGPVLELPQLRQEQMYSKNTIASVESDTKLSTELSTVSTTSTSNVVPFPTSSNIQLDVVAEKGLSEYRKEIDESLVRDVLLKSLSKESGNVSAVARGLKLDRANLLRLMRRFKIDPEVFRDGTAVKKAS